MNGRDLTGLRFSSITRNFIQLDRDTCTSRRGRHVHNSLRKICQELFSRRLHGALSLSCCTATHTRGDYNEIQYSYLTRATIDKSSTESIEPNQEISFSYVSPWFISLWFGVRKLVVKKSGFVGFYSVRTLLNLAVSLKE